MLKRVREYLKTRKHNAAGLETPDPTPLELPANCKRPESLESMIARMVRQEDFRRAIQMAEGETEDEANDFEIDGDDPEELFSASERMAHALMETDDVSEGRAAAVARASGRKRGGREDSRGEDDEGVGRARRIRRDESSADDDADERDTGRAGESRGEGRGRGDDRGKDDRIRGR